MLVFTPRIPSYQNSYKRLGMIIPLQATSMQQTYKTVAVCSFELIATLSAV